MEENRSQTSEKLKNEINFWKNFADNKESSTLIKASINDAYQNLLGEYGEGQGVAQKGANFTDSRQISWDFNRLNRIYRSQPLVAKISTTWANEMVKSGIDLRSEIDTNRVSRIEQLLKIHNNSLSNGANWGFIFGLSACLIYLKGEFNETALSKPLDTKLIRKGDFLGLKTVIRWQGIMPKGTDFVDELGEKTGATSPEELGEPLYYEVWFLNSTKKYTVHRSRLVIFNGLKLPGIENQVELGAGVSLVERIWLPLLNYLATINYVQNMLQISQQRVLYLAEGDRIGLQSDEGQAQFQHTMHQMARNTDVYNMLVLDQNDEFDYKSANFSNLDRIIQSAQEDLAAAANMPLNKLFGKSPTGLNNSSKENLIDFYDYISRLQNMYMRPAYEKLIPIIYKSEYGEDIGEFSFDFKSLFMPDEEEKALIIDRKTRPLQKAWETNAITLLSYMKELKDIGKVSDCFTNITDEDIDYIISQDLSYCRYSDFENGYIVNSQFITNVKDLKKKFNDNSKQNNKNNTKTKNNDDNWLDKYKDKSQN